MIKNLRQTSVLPGESLWWWAMDEIDPLLDVALQASLASLEKFLLIVVNLGKDVVGFLCSGGLMFG